MTASKTTATVFTDRTGKDYVRIDWPSGANKDIYPNDRSELWRVPVWLRSEVEKMLDYLADNQPTIQESEPFPISSGVDVPTDSLVDFISDLVQEVRDQGVHSSSFSNFGRNYSYHDLAHAHILTRVAIADSIEDMIWRIAKSHGVRRKDDKPVSEGP